MKLKIFFSWQMTTSTKYNKYFILDCIKKSVKKLKNKPELKGVEFIIQEGITGEPGSVQVASKIVDERIPNCDIFIADLSVVNYVNKFGKLLRKISRDKYKPFQNTNVSYEYGVAYDAIGKERIIGVIKSPNNRLHYLETIHSEVERVKLLKPAKRLQFFLKNVEEAISKYKSLTNVFKPSDYKHLLNWKEVFEELNK